jgi:hypothetical protein
VCDAYVEAIMGLDMIFPHEVLSSTSERKSTLCRKVCMVLLARTGHNDLRVSLPETAVAAQQ